MDHPPQAQLERAELAARERRLAAHAEADRILEAARAEAGAIGDGVDDRIAAALAERRGALLDQASVEAAAIEAEVAALGPALGGTTPPVDDERQARIRAVAERIVAAVLLETPARMEW